MIEVEILNFQSIERAALRIEGFTVLVGRSNIGKSAVVRAIKCALTAPKGTDFVRHGESCERRLKRNKKCRCQTTVTFALPEMKVVWEKGDSVNQYTVTMAGEEPVLYTAINHGTPEFLLPEFAPFKIGSDKADLIQVSEQFSPIFLLDQSGPATADVLSDVARLDSINKAIGMVNKDRKDAVSTRKVREKDLQKLTTTLESYEGLDDAVGRAKAIEGRYEALEAKQESLVWLDQRAAELSTLAPAVEVLIKATKPELPAATELREKGESAAQIHKFYDELVSKAPVFKRLQKIDKVSLPAAEPVEDQGKHLARLDGWLGRLRGFKPVTKQWKDLQATALPELPDDTTKLGQLQDYIDRLRQLDIEERHLSVEHHKAVSELKTAEEEFAELGMCPTCSQDINAEHVHRAVV